MSSIQLGSLLLTETLGAGAMGTVRRGHFVAGAGEGREVAVKILSAKYALHPNYRALFRREVAGVAGLDHPRIVSIYDYGEVSDDDAHTQEWMVRKQAIDPRASTAAKPPARRGCRAHHHGERESS